MRVGVVGGGQLALMLGEAAVTLGLREFSVLDPTPNCPAAGVATRQIVADFADAAGLEELSRHSDVLTFEIELAGATQLAALAAGGARIEPAPATLATIQDKYRQKQHLTTHGVAVAPFAPVAATTPQGVAAAVAALGGFPIVLKSRRGGYDGRGNATVADAAAVPAALARLAGRDLYAESLIPFERELGVMVARTAGGQVVAHPVVDMVHARHILQYTIAPAAVPPAVALAAAHQAKQAIASFAGAGIFGVELFAMADGRILVNEIAPRPHNSGHYTIEACRTSQFEQHLRAICDLPLGPTSLKVPAAVMLNILGENETAREARPSSVAAARALGAAVHLYGKHESRFDRKMGHLTVVGERPDEALARARAARAAISI